MPTDCSSPLIENTGNRLKDKKPRRIVFLATDETRIQHGWKDKSLTRHASGCNLTESL